MTTSPQRPTPAATVLVASTRCWIELSRCLSDLANCLREEALGREVEVLTLHGPDDDSAIDLVQEEHPAAKVLVSRTRSVPALFNFGARHARGDVLLFLDDTAWPQKGWLRSVLDTMANQPGTQAVTPSLHSVQGTLTFGLAVQDAQGNLVPWGAATPVPTGSVRALPECGFAVRRQAYFALGGLDERLCARFSAMDLALRLNERHGNRCTAHVESASVTRVSASRNQRAASVERPWFSTTRSHVAFAARHRGLLAGATAATLTHCGAILRNAARACLGRAPFWGMVSATSRQVLGIPCGWLSALALPRKAPLQPLTAPDPVLVPVDPIALLARRREPAVQARAAAREGRETVTA